jgi:hypothetical protein
MHEVERIAYTVLVRKDRRRETTSRPDRMSKDNIKMGVREIAWGGMGLIQDMEQ